jgi:hypothetical protein
MNNYILIKYMFIYREEQIQTGENFIELLWRIGDYCMLKFKPVWKKTC